ncbi:MAG: primosomal protein N' [Victivallales bacterium]|nr:primosomal protein N' [Victivallales bacterium]
MTEYPSIAEVAFNLATGQGFDYAVPPELQGRIQCGSRVTAPFRKEVKSGYVIRLKNESRMAELKPLLGIEDASRQVPPQLMRLADWMCEYYCAPHECVVWNLLPAVVRKGSMEHKECIYINLAPKARDLGSPEFEALTPKRKNVIRTLLKLGGVMPSRELLGAVDASQKVVDDLVAAGWLERSRRVEERSPFGTLNVQPDQPKKLTAEQSEALKVIAESLDAPAPKPILLFGVTGSGKTEVYLQAIAKCLEQGRDAIVLVPEISLTPQTVTRFRARFGDMVSVLHSGLTDGQRFDEWTKINEGRSRIAVGARSALFAPFRNLGLIVVDEEHENTYKQDEMPHYNARDVAVVRGVLEKCSVVLGSATPSLESYYNTVIGKYQLARLSKRVDGASLPPIELVDMREESAALKDVKKAGFFSRRLTELVNDRLARGEQIILFLNRRGYASQLSCAKCGWTAMCDNCSLAYTYHRKINKLICHLCGAMLDVPAVCPSCGDKEIRYGGFGTERIETVTRAAFPNAVVARMDSDTMTNAESYRKILDSFRAGHIDILIGTQMIAKGLDFPRVTLVGIIQADIGLNVPDFRSAERTFALITQVAGRAGRGDVPGRVVVQTYTPDNYALEAAQKHDYQCFYDQEMPGREMLEFPPFTHMVLLEFKGDEEELCASASMEFQQMVTPLLPQGTQIIGPMPAPLNRVAGKYRYHLLLRAPNVRAMVAAVRRAKLAIPAAKLRKVKVDIDVDPRFLQ